VSIVPSPTQFPSACIACQSQKGPIYYGGTVTSAALALYICRTCAEKIAREFGLTEGEEMDRLRGAAEELAQRETEAKRHAQEMQAAAKERHDLQTALAKTQGERDEARGQVATMERQSEVVREYAQQIGIAQTPPEKEAVGITPEHRH
jgi:Skp family chaperone for outer membrane proteins